MATAGSIVVDLLARTGSFETDMDRAARKLKGVGQEVDTVSRNINRLMVASGAALAAFAGTSAALAMQMAKGMDATAKMAEQIGTTTEALTGLRFAAQQFANVSDQTFDMAMRRMTRRIEEAAQGSGGAKNALDALGLSAQQLSRLSPDKQFLALADALKNTDSQAARLRHTMAIFDTEGMPLVAALQRGSAEMERGIETARRYGLVLSQDAAQAAQQFVSNMDALSFAARGFQQALAEAVLPYLVEATNKLVEFSEKAGPAAEHVEQAFKIASVGAGALALVLGGRLVASATAVSASFVRATYDTVRYEYALARMAKQTRIASAGFATLAATSRGWSIISGILGGPGGVVATIGLAAAGFVAMAAASRDAGEGLISVADSAEEAIKKFRELGVLQRQEELTRLGNVHAEQARAASKAWADFIDQLEPTTARGARAVAQMRAEMREEVEAIRRNTSMSSRDMQQAISDLIDTWVESGRITAEQATAYRAAAAGAEKLQATANQTEQRMSTLSEEAARLDAALRGAAGGAQTLNEALSQTNEAGKKYLERLADQAITAGLKTQREQLEALVAAGKLVYTPEDLEKARKHADHIDRMNAAYKGASSAAKEFESSVKSLIAAHLPEVKATEDLHKSLATLQAAQRAGIVVGQNYTKALESINLAYAKQVNDLLPESIKKAQEQVKAARDQQRQLQQQIRTFGMAESAVLALAAADTDAAIAKLEAAKANEIANGATTERIKHIEAEIQVLRELRDLQLGSAGLQGQLEWREKQRQQWEDWARDVEQIFQQVGQSLTDALFEGGRSARDLIKDLFKTLTLRVVVQPMLSGLQGMVTQQLGSIMGYQDPRQQGGGGGFSFGGGSTFGAGAVSDLGGWMAGSSVQSVSDLGAKMVMSADKIAQIGGNVLGYGSAIYDLSQGKYASAALTAAGQAIGGPPLAMVGNFVGGIVDSFFDREPTTRREQRTQVEYAGGIFDITKTDDRAPAGADAAARALAEQAVQTANDIFKQVGVDAAIDSFHAIMASSYKGDRDGVASGGMLRLGDELRQFGIDLNDPNPTIQGFGGWSSAETLPRLATDIQLSVLEAFQSVSDELPNVLSDMLEGIDIRSLGEQEAQALAERFTLLTQGASQFLAAIETMPFEQLRDLSFDAAAGMVQFAGGIDNLLSAQQTYYERFYSDAERHAHSVGQLTEALAGVGVEMPALVGSTDDMLASYRALVESLDLNTEAGQQAYVTLMQTAGAFADVAQFAGQAAVESQRLADQQRQAMQALRQSFVGLAGDALAAIQQHGQERIAKLSESFARTDAVFNAYRSQVQQLESQWGSLITTMQRSMRDLRGRVDASARLQYDQARAVISTALLTGQLPQTADLGEAIRVAQQGVTGGRYASAFDQREAYLKLANELEALQGIAQPELDTARASLAQLEKQYNRLRGIEDLSGLSLTQLEKQLGVALSAEAAARTQIAQIEQQIALAQLQYQQLVGINDELSTLPGALKALAKAIDAASRVPAESTAVNREARYLANNPDVLAAYVRGDWGVQTAEEAARYHWEKYGKYEGRSFARGGYYPGGLALVGEEGPELINFARPGQVYRADQTQDILRQLNRPQGGTSRETEQLLREQLAEVRQQNRYLYEIVKSGKRTERNTGDTAMAIAHGGSDDVLLVTY